MRDISGSEELVSAGIRQPRLPGTNEPIAKVMRAANSLGTIWRDKHRSKEALLWFSRAVKSSWETSAAIWKLRRSAYGTNDS
jgi:hypothetical protein